jgi:pimeloyl-ACP methyl ester carboxylesterase
MTNPYIHYQERGEGDQSIVLVHGLPSTLHEWDGLSQLLAQNGYRSVALDLPGHGDSFKPQEAGNYTANSFYDYFHQWIDNLYGCRPSILIGHSFGGYLSIRYACEHQDEMRGLILINPFLDYDQLHGLYRLVLKSPAFSSGLIKNAPERLVRFLVWAGSLTAENYRIFSPLSKNDLNTMMLAYQRCSPLITHIPKTVKDYTEKLSTLKIPTLLIVSDRDYTLSSKRAKNLQTSMPQLTYQVIGTGHYPQITNFNRVTPKILEFVRFIHSQ